MKVNRSLEKVGRAVRSGVKRRQSVLFCFIRRFSFPQWSFVVVSDQDILIHEAVEASEIEGELFVPKIIFASLVRCRSLLHIPAIISTFCFFSPLVAAHCL